MLDQFGKDRHPDAQASGLKEHKCGIAVAVRRRARRMMAGIVVYSSEPAESLAGIVRVQASTAKA
jgi:hypothetical protein